jgi:hypothetical protein
MTSRPSQPGQDEIRTQKPETFGWHFVDIPMNSSGFDEQRDCYRPTAKKRQPRRPPQLRSRPDRNFRGGLSRQERLKIRPSLSPKISHPFRRRYSSANARISEARGGNDIHVTQFGSPRCGTRPCNLHSAWDFGLIEHAARSDEQYTADLEKLMSGKHLQPDGTPASWANESFRIAKEVWLNDGGSIDEAYFRRSIPVIDERLALAGIRLAKLLNNCLRGSRNIQAANR